MHQLVEALLAQLRKPEVSFIQVSRRIAGLISQCFPTETKGIWGATKYLDTEERRVATLPTGATLIRTKRNGQSVFYLKCNHYDNIDARRALLKASKRMS